MYAKQRWLIAATLLIAAGCADGQRQSGRRRDVLKTQDPMTRGGQGLRGGGAAAATSTTITDINARVDQMKAGEALNTGLEDGDYSLTDFSVHIQASVGPSADNAVLVQSKREQSNFVPSTPLSTGSFAQADKGHEIVFATEFKSHAQMAQATTDLISIVPKMKSNRGKPTLDFGLVKSVPTAPAGALSLIDLINAGPNVNPNPLKRPIRLPDGSIRFWLTVDDVTTTGDTFSRNYFLTYTKVAAPAGTPAAAPANPGAPAANDPNAGGASAGQGAGTGDLTPGSPAPNQPTPGAAQPEGATSEPPTP